MTLIGQGGCLGCPVSPLSAKSISNFSHALAHVIDANESCWIEILRKALLKFESAPLRLVVWFRNMMYLSINQ